MEPPRKSSTGSRASPLIARLSRLIRALPSWGLLLPFGIALLIAFLYGQEIVPIRPKRRWQEIAGVALTGLATLTGLVIWFRSRTPFRLWGAGLLAVLLCREIHFAGTSGGVYLGLLVMLLVALWTWDSVGRFLAEPRVAGLLAAGFLCYGIAVTVDQRLWRNLAVPGEKRFHVPLEETLEVVGHLLIAAALLLPTPLTSPRPQSQSPEN